MSRPAHIVVFGNEKGGSGKSTTAMHVVVALLKAGCRVASIDTDGRQRSLTRFVENRAVWAKRSGVALELPTHFTVPPGVGDTVSDIEGREFRGFAEAISRTEHGYDFIVIDTPGSNSYLMRVSHAMADTLVTPINESFIDFDVLATVDPTNFAVLGPSHYAGLVADSRRQRSLIDDRPSDWVVVRNRMSALDSRNRRHVGASLEQVSEMLGFRLVQGIAERVVYRELFPRGLTALDRLDGKTLGGEPGPAHLAARREVQDLIRNLKLPGISGEGDAAGIGSGSRPGPPPD
jgi:chromosome partitioning protein